MGVASTRTTVTAGGEDAGPELSGILGLGENIACAPSSAPGVVRSLEPLTEG